jgi:alanyl-tRNA synthetase
MVVKNDPTLMFTNAGMNQFKDIFLGNRESRHSRIANSQKCLRVSGKHNDLEEVGHDTYHHTMFEMLGNWSFGDYFKIDAINWAWEFLTETLKVDKERLYVTIFEGDNSEQLERDQESYDQWAFHIEKSRILKGSKKDNFWEMGDAGPCGPCSEIHVDIRDEAERKKLPGHELVNKGHPLVVEIWNLVFIQYNRKTDGSLELLPHKHVDTGMGFERLCMVMQGKKSNYDTDIFQSVIEKITEITGRKYGENEAADVAMRVVADHLRAVAFSIADGQIPSNNKAGYVIRRILRRAVRYGYNYLGTEEPFIWQLVETLANAMGNQYPELTSSREHISRIILEEETAFLKTLDKGLKMIGKVISGLKAENKNVMPGKIAFELFDTFGFPADLTHLILRENGMSLDEKGFDKEMNNQKARSREDANLDAGDWIVVRESEETQFTGYDKTTDKVLITKYRSVKNKGKEIWQILLDKTPFYAESGGQAGDSGFLISEKEKIEITDTIKENTLIIHIARKAPAAPVDGFTAEVDAEKRLMTANNHTATHLLHHALRIVLGKHVEQKGSLITPDRLRFDFSHFSKMSREEIVKVEELANREVRKNHNQKITNNISLKKAQEMGAMALFGEKYGDTVRVVGFGESVELCGGTHVESTASIGMIKIVSEGAIAAGIRRIEAVTGIRADEYINEKITAVEEVAALLKNQGSITEGVEKLIAENQTLRKTIEKLQTKSVNSAVKELQEKAVSIKDIVFISGVVETDSADMLKSIAFEIRKNSECSIAVLGAVISEKANLVVMVSDRLVKEKNIDAVSIIKEISSEINGGGGGQPFLATAGGKKPEGISNAVAKASEYLTRIL